MQLKRLNNRGDTIVEVMIVLAVLGLSISIAYATANRSLLNARQAQENSEATQIAQSQVEGLTLLANDTVQNIYTQPGSFCIDPTIKVSTTACTSSGIIPYNMSITHAPADSTNHTFKVVVTWPDVKGQGNDTVTIYYRVYPT